MGYLDFQNPTTYYGTQTANAVASFQIHFGLKPNGIAEEKTLAKIDEILSSDFQKGNSSEEIKKLKEDLVALGYVSFKNPNKYYGTKTEQAVKDFQKNNGLPISGIADEVTLKEIEKAMKGMRYTRYNLSLEEAVTIQMNASPQTDKNYAYVSKNYIDDNQTVTASKLNVRSGAGTKSSIVGTLVKGDKVNIISEYNGWYIIEFNGSSQWVDASPQDVEYYLNPNNFVGDTKQRFQFLDLSKGSAASAVDLNKFLAGKGILEGKGASFIRASNLHGVNDIYLLSHALLETGNGTSKLATGVQVGKDKTGKLVLVDSKNKSSLKNVKTVYNMYGIGAYDNCAVECGAKYAYENDWTTPERAIVRGATFIGNSYIKSGLNTLYKMRWNPEAMANTNAYGKQYATDIGWASKQVNSMYNLYQQIQNYTIYLDLPVYK
ncbi:hypothetical protein FHP05_04690 [Cerasibacillus terrae]|uniref:SH3b domain-containing protein n=1 Tax=Cerasibacillus terrae TaxID=2498845 RepID=A0A5C8P0C9_9BACI|nr:peptidoglycan-binding protein [Cerasibacillus terrae]TXL66685.1 hypothetical protein FHP05_04690 [Cerasibacillus terrae]